VLVLVGLYSDRPGFCAANWAEVVVREPEAARITLGLQAQHDVVELARLA
jgi:hypothetical protein